MKWYLIAIKRILKGIVAFLLPITLIISLMEKAFVLVRGLIQSIWASLPEKGFYSGQQTDCHDPKVRLRIGIPGS